MDDIGHRRARVRYEGHVQGVGFRHTVRALAGGWPVTGWVRNEPDGSVEVVVEGAESDVRALLAGIRQSPAGRWIVTADETWSRASGGLRGFEVRH